MFEIQKYPRTRHIRGSRFQQGDHDLEDVPLEELTGRHLVVEEKMDGANCGISFNDSGELLLQSRGHYLRGGYRERQFDLLKQWANVHCSDLWFLLGSRYIMYGEWMFAKHTMFYDALQHYFMEFDVLDRRTGEFLSTDARNLLLRGLTDIIAPVKVLWTGQLTSIDTLKSLITQSNFVTEQHAINFCIAADADSVEPLESIRHTDLSKKMEGLYIKWEDNGIVKGRYKFVRHTFTNLILDQEQHWFERPIIQNRLAPGCFEKLFK